jgi:hypothetical protein
MCGIVAPSGRHRAVQHHRGPAERRLLIESGPVRLPHRIAKLTAIVTTFVLALAILASHASAQVVEITPLPTESPSSKLAPGTQWIYWMAIGAGVIAALILLGVATGYVRFAPKFFGREEPATPLPPGTRPPTLARQAAQMRYTPPPAAQHAGAAAPAPAGSATATATAVAERPTPAPRTAPAPAAAASAAPTATATPAEAATEQTTASPSGEPAAQADAVGQAETEAPEERPTAKTAEEVGATPAAAEEPAAPAAAPEPAAAPQTPAPRAPAPQAGPGSELDQETFDRVLKEQLDRGVDRRVAEGRARAAAVVAARKKTQA